MIKDYFDFIFEELDKKRIMLYYSSKFRKILTNMSLKNEWAKKLISIENVPDVSDSYSLIDVTDKNDTISFVEVNRILRADPNIEQDSNGIYFIYDESPIFSDDWNKGRSEIGIGRWFRRIIFDVLKTSISDSDIEKFVNEYKATFDDKDNLFEIVSGEEIRKYYSHLNYEEVRGQLGNSCMRYPRCQEYLDIYVKNPEVCKLLIKRSTNDQNKIVGRSLLWTLNDGKKYQDRIYTINDSDRILFENWAVDNGYYDTYENLTKTIYVKLGNFNYDLYPYMDTFVCYNPSTKTLCNDEDLWPGKGYYLLNDTDGEFREWDVVYSEWEDSYIPTQEAVYCNNVHTYVYKSDAHYLSYKDEWAANNGDIAYADDGKWYYTKDLHFSKVMSDNNLGIPYLVPSDESTLELIINSEGDIDWCHKKYKELYVLYKGHYYLRSSVTVDPYTNELIFIDNSDDLIEKLNNEFDNTDVKEILREKLKNDLPEEIKSNILENSIYKSIEDRVDINDIYAVLKSIIVNGLTEKINLRDRDFNQDYKYFNNSTYDATSIGIVIHSIIRLCKSLDYSKLPKDIYKMYLYIALNKK